MNHTALRGCSILLWASISACSLSALEPEPVDESTQELGDPTGEEPNGPIFITDNGILSNGAIMTAMAASGLQSVANDPTFIYDLREIKAANVMRYMTECALSPEQTIEFVDELGVRRLFRGAVGLAPAWKDGPCDVTCQSWISACLFARSNRGGVRALISLRAPHKANPTAVKELSKPKKKEQEAFSLQEGAYYGNYWEVHSPQDPTAGLLCAGRDAYPAGPLVPRPCQGADNELFCEPVAVAGRCGPEGEGSVCTFADPNGAVAGCASVPDLFDGRRFAEVLTVYRSGTVCPHPDYEIGAPMPYHCSPCSYLVNQREPKCGTKKWDAACAKLAGQLCAEHDVCTTGRPLQRGSSTCVDQVCDVDAGCCTEFFEWGESCVELARALCGETCSASAAACNGP